MIESEAPAQSVLVMPRRPSAPLRFFAAFLVGLLAALALGAGVIYAFERQFDGRVLPGIVVGGTELSGLDRDAARERLLASYAGVGQGAIVLDGPAGEMRIEYSAIGRTIDVEPLLDQALTVGRDGTPLERAVNEARLALQGVRLEPTVIYDPALLAAAVDRSLRPLDTDPVDASASRTKTGFTTKSGRAGQVVDRAAVLTAIEADLGKLDAPAELRVAVEPQSVEPDITDSEAREAKATAEKMSAELVLKDGDEAWPIKSGTVRNWIGFAPTEAGLGPTVDEAAVAKSIARMAKTIDRKPRNASFLLSKGGDIVGVTAGKNGRAVDVAGTAKVVAEAVTKRAGGAGGDVVEPVLKAATPKLSTAEAEQAAPLMKRISKWTTWFPISEKNGFGANIWIPAKLINGSVVAPGETFDFWNAVGPVTRARGFRQGGAIINGRTEPQGALAGGICSCSTTLFNAALRAGLKMGARKNHYYYIDRYPLGLDATVFISGSSVTTMSFTNDTDAPILIKGINTRKGSRGYVTFELYSVPTGRKVSFSAPTVKNRRSATTITERTSTLRAGVRKQIEYPVEGKDVWVTRTVRDGSGAVIHRDTYYSHYSRITGIILVGTR
jgi:vancomycin resistance protein YoaR